MVKNLLFIFFLERYDENAPSRLACQASKARFTVFWT